MNPSKVCIVTTCMGRLEFLRRALPTWLASTDFPIVVVDYSCPDRVGDWIEGNSGFGGRVFVARHEAQRVQGVPIFNLSAARNVGGDAAAAEFLLFLDGDTLLDPGFGAWLLARLDPARMQVVPPTRLPGGRYELGGFTCVATDAWKAVGKYDPGIEGWGTDDVDMKIRLFIAGLRFEPVPEELVHVLSHDDALRTRHYLEADADTSDRKHQYYLNPKYLRKTGKPYTEWTRHPELRKWVW